MDRRRPLAISTPERNDGSISRRARPDETSFPADPKRTLGGEARSLRFRPTLTFTERSAVFVWCRR